MILNPSGFYGLFDVRNPNDLHHREDERVLVIEDERARKRRTTVLLVRDQGVCSAETLCRRG